jgi:hypothetical protein
MEENSNKTESNFANFGFFCYSGLWEKAWIEKNIHDRCKVMTIPRIDLWSVWAKDTVYSKITKKIIFYLNSVL